MLILARIACFSLLAFALAGCGSYRPLYGKGPNGTDVVASLSAISVEEQHSRAGQLVRNELLDGTSKGAVRYSVKLLVAENVFGVAGHSGSQGVRYRYNLTAHFDVIDQATSKSLTHGDSFSNVEFDTLNIPAADLAAQDTARTRAAKELGQDLRLRLAAALSAQKG